MKVGDTVYFIENRQIKTATIIKISKDFITLKYQIFLPSKDNYLNATLEESTGGIRLRKNRVYASKQEAKQNNKL